MTQRGIWVLLACASLACAHGCEPVAEPGAHEGPEQAARSHTEPSATTVRVSDAAMQRAGIRLESAALGSVGGGVRVPAEVQAEPDRIVHIAPLVEGQLTEVKGSLGQRVEPNEVLAVLRSVALGETRAALSEAESELSVAEANYARQQDLVAEKIGARRDLIEAEGALRTARARVEGLRSRSRVYGRGGSGATTLLRSPIEGEIVKRHATVGEVVGPSQTLFVVADTRSVWITGAVYPQDIGAVRAGGEVSFVSADLPGKRWEGVLDWVSPILDGATRTLPVRMVLDNAHGSLRPGLFGTLIVPRDGAPQQVVVADTALEEIRGIEVVFVATSEPGEFAVRPVSAGRREDGRVERTRGP